MWYIIGSIVAVTDASGTLITQQRYPLTGSGQALPFGGQRTLPNYTATQLTDYTYTGQRALDDAPSTGSGHSMGGLMDYKARFYSPMLGRFIQPDSLIPDAQNPQAWNRFSYVTNRPINFNDPTGHKKCDDEFGCDGDSGGGSTTPTTPIPSPDEDHHHGRHHDDGAPTLPRDDIVHSTTISGTNKQNLCVGTSYTCGVVVTDPSYPYNVPPTNIVIDGNTYTGYTWPGKVMDTAGNDATANNGGELWTIAAGIAVFNTNLINSASGNYVQGGIYFVKPDYRTYIVGIGIYNHTGSGVQLNGISIDKQYQKTGSGVIPPNSIGLLNIEPQRTIGNTSINTAYSLVINPQGNQATSIGIGYLNFHGQIGH
jgi:RHS repeat-associated protein